jgi:ribonuclease T2
MRPNPGVAGQEYRQDESWDYLSLAQFWPGTSCLYFGKAECKVPANLTGWTIHGLWPSDYEEPLELQPGYCNDSMRFNYTQIQSLRKQLDQQWPYFNRSDNPLALWAHEWNKHGTCAYSLPILRGELKYFTAALQLYSQQDIFGALSKASITPTQDSQYDLTSIFLAIVNVYNKNPQIVCFQLGESYYLDQVYQCFDKMLTLIDCPQANYGSSKNRKTHLEKQRLPLFFASEKDDSSSKQDLDLRGYFIDCPDDGNVFYVPIPDN